MVLIIELPDFIEVVSSGPGGLIVASIFFAVFFIIFEQRRETPRKSMMITIASLVGVCFIGAFVMILKNKSDKDHKYDRLESKLNSLAVDQGPFAKSYIVDKNGDRKNPQIKINDTVSINLTNDLSLRTFRNKKRLFDNYGDSILYIKTEIGTYLGYINLIELEKELHFRDTKIESEDLLYASLKRGSIEEHVVDMHLPENIGQAVKYLIEILKDENEVEDQIRTKAGKVLVQREFLNTLNPEQYAVLLNYLNSDKRKLPFRYFELAQVYTVLYSQDLLFDKEISRLKRDSSYAKYISWYEDSNNHLNYKDNSETQIRLEEWYSQSRLILDLE